ncbi:HET-domain-containing protein [Hypomontagnella monticulosa]|nr:HET-domain-containing protein [Hypomontagnella monticulosa]
MELREHVGARIPAGAGESGDVEDRVPRQPALEINLPYIRDDELKPTQDSDVEKCRYCRWNGDPRILFKTKWTQTSLSEEYAISPRQDCASCQILGSIIHTTASNENKTVTGQTRILLSGTTFTVTFKEPGSSSYYQPAVFTTMDLRGTPFEQYNIPSRKPTYVDSLFGASSQWVQSQISECLQSHQPCRRCPRDPSFLPTRLINVSAEGFGEDAVLESSSSSIPPESLYVALSYCWGKYEPECMTTPDTLEYNMERMPWSTLPPTFRDAINFTRSLGVKYLWIDSVCIIQGDREDWSREAAQMFDVYRNAYVTLAGVYGHSSLSGLRSTSMENLTVKVADLCLGKDRCPIYMRRQPHYLTGLCGDNAWGYPRTREWGPLFTRAWTYQERMITPRVIYFDKSELIFQCFSASACECGATQEELLPMQKPMKSHFFEKVIDIDGGALGSIEDRDAKLEREKQRSDIEGVWRDRILRDFSRLDISFPLDRLPAIGAIAKQFQYMRRGETYLAGLWSGSLVIDLLWNCNSLQVKHPVKKDALDRPYALPTWTWASLHSSIGYTYWPSTRNLVDIVEASCKYEENNPFGVLESSVLVLRGRVMCCVAEWHESTCSILYSREGNWTKLSDTEDQQLQGPYMDHDDTGYRDTPRRQEVYLLEMTEGVGSGYWEMEVKNDMRSYLILRSEEAASNIYSREGVMHLLAKLEKRTEAIDVWKNVWDEQSVLRECDIR